MRNDSVPRISHTEPLPSPSEREGRWRQPYLTKIGDDYMWTRSTRHDLTSEEKRAGLSQTLVAESESLLAEMVKAEEERYAAYKRALREHNHRNTL